MHHLTTRPGPAGHRRALAVNLDGEIATNTPATFEVERNALHVVVPAHSRATRMDAAPIP